MRQATKTRLGILGGMGPQATQMFYQWILDRTEANSDQEHLPAVILSDTAMPDRTAAILSGETEPVFQQLLRDARTLEDCQCGCIAIPCNTSHYFADRLQEQLSIPILHMPRLTVRRLAGQGRRKAAILGTTGTLRTGIYHRECEALGLEAWVPPEEIQGLVMSLIYDEIKRGERGNRHTFARIDAAVRDAGCDCAVLGCTELSVFRGYHSLPEFYVDAMEVLADACITFFGKKLRTV